uniref:Serine-threonine/tyrosine-protein kinase catalytic domain-containing protein n=1 Tax=Brassica campestris TaxID=3711 RepID=A0A3P6AU68_BRACM|nr:unnamed protein product [Brassica rapa]
MLPSEREERRLQLRSRTHGAHLIQRSSRHHQTSPRHQLGEHGRIKIQNNALHELVDPSLGFAKDPEVKRKMMAVAELAFRCLQQEREVRPSMDEIVEILKRIKGGESSGVVVTGCGGY